MTTTYDPLHPEFSDEHPVRAELTRAFDICQDCRRCSTFCPSFATLFQMLDQIGDDGAGQMTPSQQDEVVGECYQCQQCVIECPYTPDLHEWALDFPKLMSRAQAMRLSAGYVPRSDRAATRVLGAPDRLGRLAVTVASPRGALVRKVSASPPRSRWRRLAARALGVSAQRHLPAVGQQRFSSWFAGKRVSDARQGRSVTVFPTCYVEYQAPQIGHSLVRVLERNGVSCARSATGCCGAPWLHAGDLARFTKTARATVASLEAELADGVPVLVAQPSCRYVMTQEYPRYLPGTQAAELAQLLVDPAEYLMALFSAGQLDLEFAGTQGLSLTSLQPVYGRAQGEMPTATRQLLELTGAKVTALDHGDGVDVIWPLRVANHDGAQSLAEALIERIRLAGNHIVIGESVLTNVELEQRLERPVMHPFQLLAGAYRHSEE